MHGSFRHDYALESRSTALFGYSAQETLGQNLDLIIPEHLRAAHWKGFDAAIASGIMKLQGRPTLTRALHKSGRKLYIEMTFALVKDGNGEVRGLRPWHAT